LNYEHPFSRVSGYKRASDIMEVDIMEFRVYLRQRAITADLMYTQYSGSYYNFNSSLPVSRSEISCHGLLACALTIMASSYSSLNLLLLPQPVHI
jgi:hypothetical protein